MSNPNATTELHPRTAKVIAARETYKLRADLASARRDGSYWQSPRMKPTSDQIATLIEAELDRREQVAA